MTVSIAYVMNPVHDKTAKAIKNSKNPKFGKSINGTLFIICTIYMAMQMQPKIFEGFSTAALSHYELGSGNTAPSHLDVLNIKTQ